MSDALTPLRRAYGVEAPGDSRAAPGAGGSVEEVLLFQSRAAVEATVAAQDRRPTEGVLAAVLAEASRASAEALAPLAAVRALYGELAGSAPEGEAALLAQSRLVVEQAFDVHGQSPSDAAVAAVLARASEATRLTPRPDATVEVPALAPLAMAYGLPVSGTADRTETELLVQMRALLDAAPSAVASEAAVAAVLDRASEATRLAPVPDAPVEAPSLAPLAIAYGLPLAASAGGLAPAETALLVQTRALLDAAPAADSPSEAVVAAVLARAASPAQAAPRPEAPRPAERAADREPIRAARTHRRVGAWTSAAVAALALVFVLLPRSAEAPETPGTSVAALTAAPDPSQGTTADAPRPVDAEANPSAPVAGEIAAATPNASSFAASAAPVPAPRGAPSGPVPSTVAPPPGVSRAEAPRDAVAAPVGRAAASSAPRTVERRAPPPVADETTAFVSAAGTGRSATTATPSESWDAPDDVRVLSMRLQELRRDNAGLAWDTPTETFGAPTTRAAASSVLRSVRETVPAARARLVTEPVTGDR